MNGNFYHLYLYLREEGILYRARFMVDENVYTMSFCGKTNDTDGWWFFSRGVNKSYIAFKPNDGGVTWFPDKGAAVAQWDLLRKNGWTREEP